VSECQHYKYNNLATLLLVLFREHCPTLDTPFKLVQKQWVELKIRRPAPLLFTLFLLF